MDFVPLCDPWPAVWCEGQLTPTVTGAPLLAASEALWEHSGRRFGACNVLLRPCRRSCTEVSESAWWWDTQTWPRWSTWPMWLDVTCGRCKGACSCTDVSEVDLPLLVQGVTEVLIDGETLPASGYALYDGFKLVKTDGRWPLCQTWTVPVSGVGAWSITATYGHPVPVLGRLAVAELASEIDKACRADSGCRLAGNVQSIVRAGVTQNFVDPTALRKEHLTGLRLVDQFLNAVNPDRIRAGPRIWNPDDYGSTRIPGGIS